MIGHSDAVLGSLPRASSFDALGARPPASVYARTDADKLRQIMINLLSNAVKFTPEGGRIRLSCTVLEKSVSIHVEDNGPGIPHDKQEAVFQPFVQLDQGLTRTTEGTGLGLAISRGLSRGMGGEVQRRRNVGAGGRFTVTVPLAAPRSLTTQSSVAPASALTRAD